MQVKKKRFELKPLAKALALLSASVTLEQAMALNLLDTQSSPWTPRIMAQGLFGNQQQGAGLIDFMVPLRGNNQFMWFLDGSYATNNNEYHVGSIGSGIRKRLTTTSGDVILGGYVFADKTYSSNDTHAWFVNPGVEALTSHYEARVQGYIPASNRHQRYQNTFASMIPQSVLNDSGQSIYNLAFGKGHSFLDTPVALTQEFGPGVEAEVGRYIPFLQGGWLRGGVYHFNYRDSKNITGVEANVEIFANRQLAILIQNNYDNQNKNRFSIGFRLTFGGPDNRQVDDLSNRMEDPIIRHIARQSYGEGTPSRQNFETTGPTQATFTNVWYFAPYGVNPSNPITFADCTAENPCNLFNQPTADGINAIAPKANLFFATGTYDLPSNPINGDNWVNLYNAQTFWGRTYDFRQVATGNNRPLINGGLFWGDVGNGIVANGYVNNMQLFNQNQIIPMAVNGINDDVIGVGANGNIRVLNSIVRTAHITNIAGDVFTSGVFVTNASNIATVSGSTITTMASNPGGNALSLGVRSLGDANVNYTLISATANGEGFSLADGVVANQFINVGGSTISTMASSASANVESYGVRSNNADANVDNSSISATANGDGFSQANGVLAGNTATVSGSTITSSASSASDNARSDGVRSLNEDANVDNSSISASANGDGVSQAFGVSATNVATVIGSTITSSASSTSGNARSDGVRSINEDANVDNSSISATAIGDGVSQANGVLADNTATVSGSTITTSASSTSANARSNGVRSLNDNANVDNSSISATANGAIVATTSARGVDGVGGTVTATDITVNGNGTNTKCIGASSLDGSCNP